MSIASRMEIIGYLCGVNIARVSSRSAGRRDDAREECAPPGKPRTSTSDEKRTETTKKAARASKDEASMKSSPGRESAAGNDAPSSFLPAPSRCSASSLPTPSPAPTSAATPKSLNASMSLLCWRMHSSVISVTGAYASLPSSAACLSLAEVVTSPRRIPDTNPSVLVRSRRVVALATTARRPKTRAPSRPRLPSALRSRA